MPLYTGDYLRDTRHLTPLRHGIYILLLMHCWDQKGPLPLDEQECAGIANCRSHDEVDALRYILQRFFVRMEDGWYNERMQQEVERCENLSRARAEAGRKGYEARAKHLPSKSQAIASIPIPTPILSPPQKQEEPSVLPENAARFRCPPCPTQQIVDLYHKHLPMLPAVLVVSDARKRNISARWHEVCGNEKFDGAQGLEWFGWFFGHVRQSAFLTGRAKDWKADIDFLMTASKFAKIIEGAYHKEAA